MSSADLSGPAVFRVIQCESPCRGVWVQDWFQGQSCRLLRAFGVHRALYGGIFTMLRAPTHPKDAWRFRHGAFVNSEREVIRAFHLLSKLDGPGRESSQPRSGS